MSLIKTQDMHNTTSTRVMCFLKD